MNILSIPRILLALLFLCILRPWRKSAPVEVAEDSGTGDEFYFHALTMGEVEDSGKRL